MYHWQTKAGGGLLCFVLACSQDGSSPLPRDDESTSHLAAVASMPGHPCDSSWTGPCCDIRLEVAVGATASAADAKHFLAMAVGAGGVSLATDGSQVVALTGPATGQAIYHAPPNARIELSPSVARFGVLLPDRFEVHDSAGALALSLGRETGQYFRLIPETDRVLVAIPTAENTEERPVRALRILDAVGSSIADVPVARVAISRTARRGVFYSDGQQLVRLSIDGAEKWHRSASLDRFEVSDDASLVLAVGGSEGSRVVFHYGETGDILGSMTAPAAIWNLAVSPTGAYSMATSKNRIWLYQRASLVRTIDVPVRYLVSAAVSDRGYVLVGAQDAEQRGQVLLFDLWGNRLWQQVLGHETQAYRPEVRFLAGGEAYLVREKSRIVTYSLAQGLP